MSSNIIKSTKCDVQEITYMYSAKVEAAVEEKSIIDAI